MHGRLFPRAMSTTRGRGLAAAVTLVASTLSAAGGHVSATAAPADNLTRSYSGGFVPPDPNNNPAHITYVTNTIGITVYPDGSAGGTYSISYTENDTYLSPDVMPDCVETFIASGTLKLAADGGGTGTIQNLSEATPTTANCPPNWTWTRRSEGGWRLNHYDDQGTQGGVDVYGQAFGFSLPLRSSSAPEGATPAPSDTSGAAPGQDLATSPEFRQFTGGQNVILGDAFGHISIADQGFGYDINKGLAAAPHAAGVAGIGTPPDMVAFVAASLAHHTNARGVPSNPSVRGLLPFLLGLAVDADSATSTEEAAAITKVMGDLLTRAVIQDANP